MTDHYVMVAETGVFKAEEPPEVITERERTRKALEQLPDSHKPDEEILDGRVQ